MKLKLMSLVKDREFQFRAAILAGILIFMGWQFYTVHNQKDEIVVLKKEKARKQALLLAKKNNKTLPEEETNYRLEGTTMKDGTFQALINGAIYKVGDFVDQYKVTEITLRSSTLQNLNTNEIRKLHFAQE